MKDAVRGYLVRGYPRAFSSKSWVDLWTPNKKAQDISGSMKTLAALNGYEVVPVPKMEETIPLAEGLLAKPNFYSRIRKVADEKFVLLAQPMDDYAQPDYKKKERDPELVEEDTTIYRILENRVDQYLNSIYNALGKWLSTRIQRPLESLVGRAGFKTAIQEPPDDPNENNSLPIPQNDTSQKENLLVIGSKEIVLISNMEPSLRLLALPHTLRHKSASTLISVSLVVFGALPLAYRSLNFALSYPGLSEGIAASVVGTVSYGIWSSRDMARTRQSQIISNAISHRIYARDDAVLWVLQEGAIRRVSKAVLALYFHYYHVRDDNKKNTIKKATVELPPLPRTLIDPLNLAVELGLIEQTKNGNETYWAAISLEDASARLKSK
jgi:hypothetical protein